MYSRFSLILAVNHACNLRCAYCYTGAKFSRPMPEAVGRKAIDRAIASLTPGGTLELGFFGGEPLLEPDLIAAFIEYARISSQKAGTDLQLSMTTNGTLSSGKTWDVMMLPDLNLAVSHDGLPGIHDQHRRTPEGRGSSAQVEIVIKKLLAAGKELRIVMVVRPNNLEFLPQGIEYLRAMGVRRIELSLDLWTRWTREDGPRLESAIAHCAQLWRAALPSLELSWFDERAARLAHVPLTETARCGFGDGQIAIAPSGNMYPCERLIGDDAAANSMRLHGHTLEGGNFLGFSARERRSAAECGNCELQALCGATCRCSNYVRTGRIEEPDGLLCLLEQACLSATAQALGTQGQKIGKSHV